MPFPHAGDILIRSLTRDHQFTLLDIVMERTIAGPFEGFQSAVAHARSLAVRAVWQQSVNARGRVLGDPFRLPDQDGRVSEGWRAACSRTGHRGKAGRLAIGGQGRGSGQFAFANFRTEWICSRPLIILGRNWQRCPVQAFQFFSEVLGFGQHAFEARDDLRHLRFTLEVISCRCWAIAWGGHSAQCTGVLACSGSFGRPVVAA